MKLLIILFLCIAINIYANNLQQNIKHKVFIEKVKINHPKKEIEKYQYKEIYNYDLTLTEFFKQKPIKRYKLDFKPRFCKGDINGCYNTGIKLKYFKSMKYPLILLSTLIGIHSKKLMLFNPNLNSDKEFEKIYGNYSIDYKENSDGFTIVFDSDCKAFECPNYIILFYSPYYLSYSSFYFEKDRYTLDTIMKDKVKQLAEFFNKYISGDINQYTAKQKMIKLIGHTHTKGTDEYNYALGLKQANEIKKLLISFGVDSQYIVVSSHGKINPLYEEYSKLCDKQNRRVEFLIW